MKKNDKNKYLKLIKELLSKMGEMYYHFDKVETLFDDIYYDTRDIFRIIKEDIENKK